MSPGRPRKKSDDYLRAEAHLRARLVIAFLEEGWSVSMATAKAGLSWQKHRKFLLEVKAISAAYESKMQFIVVRKRRWA